MCLLLGKGRAGSGERVDCRLRCLPMGASWSLPFREPKTSAPGETASEEARVSRNSTFSPGGRAQPRDARGGCHRPRGSNCRGKWAGPGAPESIRLRSSLCRRGVVQSPRPQQSKKKLHRRKSRWSPKTSLNERACRGVRLQVADVRAPEDLHARRAVTVGVANVCGTIKK